MAKKKRRKSTARRSPSVRRSAPTRRKTRRKKGLLGASMNEVITHAKGNGLGAVGGALYAIPTTFMKPSLLGRAAIGIGGAFILSFFGSPFMGAGMSGACGHDLTVQLLSKTGLHDGELEDVEYVDPSTLQDSGYMDEDGNTLPMDEDGIIYSLNDAGEYEAVGDAYSLQDAYDLQDVANVQMLPAYIG